MTATPRWSGRFTLVAQLRDTLARLEDADELITNGVENLSVVRGNAIIGHIELADHEANHDSPTADLVLYGKRTA